MWSLYGLERWSFGGKGFLIILTYRGVPSLLEVEVGLAFRMEWSCRKANVLMCLVVLTNTPIKVGCLVFLVLLRIKVLWVFYIFLFSSFLGPVFYVLSG